MANATYETEVRFGKGANYTNTAIDGEITQFGTARVEKQMWIQAESIKSPGVSPATFQDVGISGAWEFADGSTKVVICKFPLPTDIDYTENVTIYLGWSTPAISKNCRWQVEYLLRKADEDVTAVAEDTLTQNEGSSATANGMTVSDFTIPAASIDATDNCLLLRISRIGGHGDDTLSNVANLHGVCFHYVSDKLGTAT